MRWAIAAAIFLVACGGTFAADTETRQQKIDRLCKEKKWAQAEPYALAEVQTLKREYELPPRTGHAEAASGLNLVREFIRLAKIYDGQQMWKESLATLAEAERVAGEKGPLLESDPTDEARAAMSVLKGRALFGQKKYAEARHAFELALALADIHRPDDIETAKVLVDLANASLAQGVEGDEKAAVIAHLRRATAIFEEKLGKDADWTKSLKELTSNLKKYRNVMGEVVLEEDAITTRYTGVD